MIYLISQISVVLLTKITPNNFFAPGHVVKMNGNGRGRLKGSKSLPWQRGECPHRRKAPAMWLLISAVGSRQLVSPAMASELRMGEGQMWLPTREPSDFWVLFASAYCTKEPEKTVRGPKDVWPWNDQQMWSDNGPWTLDTDGNERYYQATTCSSSTHLHSPFLQAMGVTVT